MPSAHVKCIMKYSYEVSLVCECTRELHAVVSVPVKCVFMHARNYIIQRKCMHAHAKIASKS